jgi:hypothetical protein
VTFSRLGGCVAALVGITLAASASAQVPVEPADTATAPEPLPLARALTGEARVAYDDAKLLLQNGDPAGAVAKFQRAYVLSGDARLLWNIAACEKALRHYASASEFVGRYLREGDATLSDEARRSALATQQALRAFFSEVKLLGLPAGARVSGDGVPVAVAPLVSPLRVDLGKRLLRVDLEGYETLSRALDVPGTTDLEVELALKPKSRTATLSVLTGEASAVIAIDGKVVGSARWQGNVPAGPHRVRVTARARKPYELSFELAAGSSRTLQIALVEERSSVWPWLVGAAAVSLAAGVGGYLLLKPDDMHVPAPRGELGNIQLPLTGGAR